MSRQAFRIEDKICTQPLGLEVFREGDNHFVAFRTETYPSFTMAGMTVWCAPGEEQHALETEWKQVRKYRNRIVLTGIASAAGRNAPRYDLALSLNLQQPNEPWIMAEVELRNGSRKAYDTSVQVLFAFGCSAPPRWLIPGMFYKDNGYEKSHRIYPRFHPTEYEPDKFVSPYWSFRADRCATPVVFGQSEGFSYFLSTDEQFSHGISSVGFSYDAMHNHDHGGCGNEDCHCDHPSSAAMLSLSFPWSEVPVQYAPHNPNHLDGEVGYVELAPGETMRFSFRIGIIPDPEDPAFANYGFVPVLRGLYACQRPQNPPQPWMPPAEAAELAAYGIYHWFYQRADHVLVETCSFDKYFAQARNLPGYVDRPHMHVSWVSGIAYAYAMARWGEEHGRNDYARAGQAVIDKICREGLAPCGAFWAQWVKEKNGWDAGWNRNPEWLHARTLGEACLFLAEAIAYDQTRGRQRRIWRAALRSCLDFAVAAQAPDGNPGTYYHSESGSVQEWSGTAGMAWITAWLAGGRVFPREAARYQQCAERAGVYYRRYLDDAYLYGGCEDVSLSPCSEDGYMALMAYASLYEATQNQFWLVDACRAAEWMLTFRWMYNVTFPQHTFLKQYDFRTVGGDVASPPNQHLHNYGLVALEALLKLWIWTGEPHYYDCARDNLHYSLQMIARADGDLNARRGMMSEQWYHTDWWQPKGSMLQLAHVWCAGFLILADYALQRLVTTVQPRYRNRLRELTRYDDYTPF